MPLLLDETAIFGVFGAIFIGIPFAIAYLIAFIVIAFRARGDKRIVILLVMALIALVIFPSIFSPLRWVH
ncbi:hypothetical protein [Hymenobacter ruricola]|uniref:Cardiolipin synthase N-terminal domain-containing protein n=1 Tax=Hymenobacter ruricola TaxID=2791023 RepID=A0ABS0IAP1_9BACT|nr:hypothetical protein [Hymenobacter ruricola]MBF9224036.1 hypothetical protein [Hymenobacter ruricola]